MFRIVLGLTALGVSLSAQDKPSVPELKLTLTLERESLVSDDSVIAHLWLANQSRSLMTGIRLGLDAPDFLTLEELRSGHCLAVTGGGQALADLRLGWCCPGPAAFGAGNRSTRTT